MDHLSHFSRKTLPQRLTLPPTKCNYHARKPSGEVTERPNVPVSKTGVPVTVPGVRIPPSPLQPPAAIVTRWLLLFCAMAVLLDFKIVLKLY